VGVSSAPGWNNSFLSVRKSGFLEGLGLRGYGLYAETRYEPGEFISEYIGRNISNDEAEGLGHHQQYFFEVKGVVRGKEVVDHVIDSYFMIDSNATRYVNAANTYDQQNGQFVQIGDRIFLKALKTINAGDEIVAHYGDDQQRIINPN
jgi:SET domain-containing protein